MLSCRLLGILPGDLCFMLRRVEAGFVNIAVFALEHREDPDFIRIVAIFGIAASDLPFGDPGPDGWRRGSDGDFS